MPNKLGLGGLPGDLCHALPMSRGVLDLLTDRESPISWGLCTLGELLPLAGLCTFSMWFPKSFNFSNLSLHKLHDRPARVGVCFCPTVCVLSTTAGGRFSSFLFPKIFVCFFPPHMLASLACRSTLLSGEAAFGLKLGGLGFAVIIGIC